MEEKTRAGSSRLDYLDGLRGLAALSVALTHYFSFFLPWISSPGAGRPGWSGAPLALMTNSTFAIYIFFVLSGFVLSRSAQNRSVTLPARLLARYARLTAPMVLALLFAWVLYQVFPAARLEVMRLMPNGWASQGSPGEQIPGVGQALQDGFFRVYLGGKSLLDAVVWTMRNELIGSFLIYFIYRAPSTRWRVGGLAALGIFGLSQAAFLAFAAGGLLWEMRRAERLRSTGWSWALLLLGLAMAYEPTFRPMRHIYEAFLHAAGAGLVVLGILTLPVLQEIFGSRWPRFLGRISFAFYLLHMPVLFTAGAWLFLRVELPFYFRVMGVLVIFLGLAMFLAWLMTAGFDEPLLRRLHRMKRLRGT
jgi:peptidoglycan/LPS O-acetylase OafA/YrhL